MNYNVNILTFEQRRRIGELEDLRDSLPYVDGEPDKLKNKEIDGLIQSIVGK